MVNYILPLVTLPYLVRVLGTELFGLVMFAQAFILYFTILTDYGFNLSATKEISINRGDKNKVSEIFVSVMLIKTLLLLISLIILIAIVFSFDKFKDNWIIYILTFGMVLGNYLFPVWFFQGMEKMKYITLLNITAKSVFTVLIFVFIKDKSDYLYVPIFNSLGFLVAGLLSCYLILKNFRIRLFIPSAAVLYSYFRGSTQFFLSRASVSIYSNSNAFVIGLFLGNVSVGLYSAAEKLFIAMRMLYNPLSTALYPFMCSTKNIRLFKKIFILAFWGNLALCLIVFSFSDIIINVLYDGGYEISSNLLKIFSMISIFIIPSILLGYPFLAALGQPKYANLSVVIGSISHLVLLIIIIPRLSIYLVAFVTLVTELLVLIIRIYGVKKHKLWSVL